MAQEACPDKMFVNSIPCAGGVVHVEKIDECMHYRLTPIPGDGYEFLYWIDDPTADNIRVFTASSTTDKKVCALFGKKADLHFTYGSVVAAVDDPTVPSFTLTAQPLLCGTFIKWNTESTDMTIPYVESDGIRTPEFKWHEMLHRNKGDEVGGVVEVTPLTCGFTLTATPKEDYHFAFWKDEPTNTNPIRDVDYIETEYEAYFSNGAAYKNGNVFASVQGAIDDEADAEIVMLQNQEENLTIAKPVTLSGNGYTTGDITITTTGDLTLNNELIANNLYLSTTQGASSQLHNAANLTCSNAYVDIRLEPEKSVANPNKYYAIGVPAQNVSSSDITRQSVPNDPTTNFQDYVLWAYDGAMRASTQQNGWQLMASGTLYPGQFYMFGIDGTENIWRFRKKADAALGGDATLVVSEFPSDIPNRGWNALANSQLFYAKANMDGIDYAQVYDNTSESGKYDVVRLDESSFVMACPFFIQSAGDGVLTLTENHTGDLYAPARTQDNKVINKVTLSQDEQVLDKLYLTARDNATDTYEVGKDVIKIMGGTADSYIWANGYGYRLCAQDMPLEDDLEYSITLYAAQAGDYALTATMGYLYYQGIYMADLSRGNYSLYLDKGSNEGYSIRLHERYISTNTENETVRYDCQKYIDRGVLYIRNNGRTFNAQGGLVK